jgi:hypothetical protein
MGRVMVPVSLLNHESLCGWFPLGRTTTRDAQFTGEIYLELRIKSQLVRHAIQHSRTDEMYSICHTYPSLIIQSLSIFLPFSPLQDGMPMISCINIVMKLQILDFQFNVRLQFSVFPVGIFVCYLSVKLLLLLLLFIEN